MYVVCMCICVYGVYVYTFMCMYRADVFFKIFMFLLFLLLYMGGLFLHACLWACLQWL